MSTTTKYEEPPPPYPGTEPAESSGLGAPPPYPGANDRIPSNIPSRPPPNYDGSANENYRTEYFGTFPPPTQTNIVVSSPVVVGNCPRCGLANLEDTPDLGLIVCLILMAFLFTPLTLCCIPCAFHQKCPNCGYSSG